MKPPPVPFNDKTRELLRLLAYDPVIKEVFALTGLAGSHEALLILSRMDLEAYQIVAHKVYGEQN